MLHRFLVCHVTDGNVELRTVQAKRTWQSGVNFDSRNVELRNVQAKRTWQSVVNFDIICDIKFASTFCKNANKPRASTLTDFALSSQNTYCKWLMQFIAWPRKDCEVTQRLSANAKSLQGNAKTLRGNAKLCEGTQKYCVTSQSLRKVIISLCVCILSRYRT